MKEYKTINQNKIDMEIGYKKQALIDIMNGAKWQQEKMLAFINDEDNHTEGELGNSCIDVQTLVNFIEQFKK